MKELLLKRKGIRRVLSFVFCLVMCITLMPVAAMAASGSGSEYDPICVTNFAEFKAAMEQDGKLYVKLVGNITETMPLTEATLAYGIKVTGEKVLIVEGDNTFSVNNENSGYDCLLQVSYESKLTIKGNGKLTFSPMLNNASNSVIRIDGGEVAINGNVTIAGIPLNWATYGRAIDVNSGKLTINGGYFKAVNKNKNNADFAAPTVSIDGGTFEIYGGDFEKPEKSEGATADDAALTIGENSTGVISGGSYDSIRIAKSGTTSTSTIKTISDYIDSEYAFVSDSGSICSLNTSYIDKKVTVNKLLSSVTGTYYEPGIGSVPIFGVSVPMSSNYTACIESWKDRTTNITYTVDNVGGYMFEAGHEYIATVKVTPKEGYVVSSSTKYNFNGKDGLIKTFTMPNPINKVNLTVAEPSIGAKPEIYVLTDFPADYSVFMTEWYDESNDVIMNADDVFKGGSQYTVKIQIVPDADYIFDSGCAFYLNDTDRIYSVLRNTDGSITLSKTFAYLPEEKKEITNLDIKVSNPIIDEHLDFNVPVMSHINPKAEGTSVKWYQYDSPYQQVGADHVIEQDMRYYYQATFYTEEGYQFAEDITITVNGNPLSKTDMKAMFATGGEYIDKEYCCNKVSIYYVFTPIRHTHIGTKVDKVDAICTEFGVNEYYECSCGKYFVDSECAQEITDLDAWKSEDGKIAKKEHDFSKYVTIGNGKHKVVCKDCDVVQEGHEAETCVAGDDGKCAKCGAFTDGWQKVDGKWKFYKAGVAQTGWIKDGGKWYYLDANGNMKTGWVKDGGKWYYMASSGVMSTGWKQIKDVWYYFGTNGVMVTGWQKISNKWYYFEDGAMVTGWKKISNKWYYFDDGAMVDGWKKLDGKWYYFDDGAMTTGWKKLDNKWYYFGTNGVMVSNNTITIDGKKYTFNASGVWVK